MDLDEKRQRRLFRVAKRLLLGDQKSFKEVMNEFMAGRFRVVLAYLLGHLMSDVHSGKIDNKRANLFLAMLGLSHGLNIEMLSKD